jgi:hypothetical protein
MATTQTTKTEAPKNDEPRDAATGRPRVGAEQEIAIDDGSGPEPHEVNDNLASDRMRALLEEHRKMGARP